MPAGLMLRSRVRFNFVADSAVLKLTRSGLAAGGVAVGLELERRVVAKRIPRISQDDVAELLALHSPGPPLTTPDGVVLHTEVEQGVAEDLTLVFVHGYALNLDGWHFQREHFLGQIPYRRVKRPKITMVGRSRKGAYDDEAPLKKRHWIPEAY